MSEYHILNIGVSPLRQKEGIGGLIAQDPNFEEIPHLLVSELGVISTKILKDLCCTYYQLRLYKLSIGAEETSAYPAPSQ